MAKQNNFYAQVNKREGQSINTSSLYTVAPAVAIVLVCAIIFVVLQVSNSMVKRETSAITDWTGDPENVAQYTAAQEKMQYDRDLRSQIMAADDATAAMNTYTDINSDVLGQVSKAGGDVIAVAFRSYDATTGAFVFEASSPAVIDIPGYVRSLEATQLFHSVSYTGYGFKADVNTYTINVSCLMAAAKEG